MQRNAWIDLPVTVRIRATGKTVAAADASAFRAAAEVGQRIVGVVEGEDVQVLLGIPKPKRR